MTIKQKSFKMKHTDLKEKKVKKKLTEQSQAG